MFLIEKFEVYDEIVKLNMCHKIAQGHF